MKKSKLIKGAVYRMLTYFADPTTGKITDKPTGYYMDIVCDSEIGTGTAIAAFPKSNDNYVGGSWGVGAKHFLKDVGNLRIVAESLEAYNWKPETVEVVVEKEVEVIVEREKIVNVNYWDETFIDTLYNYYCKLKNRLNEFV